MGGMDSLFQSCHVSGVCRGCFMRYRSLLRQFQPPKGAGAGAGRRNLGTGVHHKLRLALIVGRVATQALELDAQDKGMLAVQCAVFVADVHMLH